MELKYQQLSTCLLQFILLVDNAIIEIDNEEVPIMDGSAKDFLNTLKM